MGDVSTAEGCLVEPLAESAPLQLQLAETMCRDECRWYHGPRLYLRALGIIRGIQPDTQFVLDAIGHLARTTGHARVLVSGSADYSMLAHVVAAFRATGRSLTVTVLDRCMTPLRMNEWYGHYIGVPVEVYHGDIFDLAEDGAFDLICAHAFLGRFDAEGRRRLATKWYALLKPRGTVVTAHRWRHVTVDGEIPFAERFKHRLRARARRVLVRPTPLAGVTPEMITAWTSEFLRRKVTHPVYSAAEIRSFLGRAGFSVSISRHREPRAPSETRLDDSAWRIGVVATKAVRS
jgi:hypothetical protein